MNTIRTRIVARMVALTIISIAIFNVPRCISAATGRDTVATSGTSAREAIRSALDNVRRRYRNTLDYYGLKEWYYIETSNSYELTLYDPQEPGSTLSICYIKDSNTLHYQRVPKGLAQKLIRDRMMIDSYQKVLRADEINKPQPSSTQQKKTGRSEYEVRRDSIKKTAARGTSDSGMRRRPRQNRSGWGMDFDREPTSADIEAQMRPEDSWREQRMKLFDRYKPNTTPSTWADDDTGVNGFEASKGNSSSRNSNRSGGSRSGR